MADINTPTAKRSSVVTGSKSSSWDCGVYEQMPVYGMCHEGTPINQLVVATVTLSQVFGLSILEIAQLMDEQPSSSQLAKLI